MKPSTITLARSSRFLIRTMLSGETRAADGARPVDVDPVAAFEPLGSRDGSFELFSALAIYFD